MGKEQDALAREKVLRDALESISRQGYFGHRNNVDQLVKILDEHKDLADETLKKIYEMAQSAEQQAELREPSLSTARPTEEIAEDCLAGQVWKPAYPNPNVPWSIVRDRIAAALQAERERCEAIREATPKELEEWADALEGIEKICISPTWEELRKMLRGRASKLREPPPAPPENQIP